MHILFLESLTIQVYILRLLFRFAQLKHSSNYFTGQYYGLTLEYNGRPKNQIVKVSRHTKSFNTILETLLRKHIATDN